MPTTGIRSTQVKDGEVKRPDLNYLESGSAVVRKVTVAGRRLKITYDGADAGTGDVSIELEDFDILLKSFLLNGASSDMAVNGSVTPVVFQYQADATVDSWLDKIIFVLEDEQIGFNTFGDLAALTTGLDIQITQNGVTSSIWDKVKTTYQAIKACNGEWDLISKINLNNDEGIVIVVQLNNMKLAAGTTDKIFATVNDDLSDLTNLTACVVIGREYP